MKQRNVGFEGRPSSRGVSGVGVCWWLCVVFQLDSPKIIISPRWHARQIPYPEDFDDLNIPDGSVDTIVSTFMW
jgi:hypothetical protein